MIPVSSSCVRVVVVELGLDPLLLLGQVLDRKRIVGMRHITVPAPYTAGGLTVIWQ
jgi:hypothetical protein